MRARGDSARAYGLSPLARGTLQVGAHQNHLIRFIPAGAGNTLPYFFIVHVHAVYPRWRGEHSVAATPVVPLPGLSPLARGTPFADNLAGCQNRFIPAGAGNTRLARSQNGSRAVYPRWRGEHFLIHDGEQYLTGLSPLARGTPLRVAKFHTKRRFIPAGAGNTLVVRFWNPIKAVYPRWRGEHAPCNLCAADSAGLSPLARGTPIIPAGIERLSRFIPAGAGNTSRLAATRLLAPVYPRWRGEHTKHT